MIRLLHPAVLSDSFTMLCARPSVSLHHTRVMACPSPQDSPKRAQQTLELLWCVVSSAVPIRYVVFGGSFRMTLCLRMADSDVMVHFLSTPHSPSTLERLW